jgi:phage shock protein PspC (stress-responsive transcriptional regulator)
MVAVMAGGDDEHTGWPPCAVHLRPGVRVMSAPSTVRPRLRRPRDGRILAGLSIGLARHLGIDVVIVRVLLVVLTVVTNGLVALAYLVAIFLVPVGEPDVRAGASTTGPRTAGAPGAGGAPQSSPWSTAGERDPQFWLGIGLLVIGAVWLLGGPGVGPFVPGGNVLVPLALIGFGLALWHSGDRAADRDRPTAAPVWPASAGPPVPSGPPVPPAGSVADRTQEITMPTAPTAPTAPWTPDGPSGPVPPADAGPTPPGWEPPPVPDRPRSLLTRLTLGIALVTAGVLWALDLAGVLQPTLLQYLAAVLLVIGLGTLVGAFVGRSRTLIVLGAVLVPVVLLAGLVSSTNLGPWISFGSDVRVEQIVVPSAVDELEPRYEVDAGRIELDLRELDLAGERIEVDVRIGAGEIVVRVPEEVGLVIEAEAGIGQIDLVGRASSGGIAPNRTWSRPADDGAGTIQLDLSAGVGSISVRETGPTRAPTALDPAASIPALDPS